MGWWSGIDTVSPRDRFVTWDTYSKIRDLQLSLLKATAKKAYWWSLLYQGVCCSCSKESEGVPENPHDLCYGTGIVGGYHLFGTHEWIVTLDFVTGSGLLMVVDVNKGVIVSVGGSVSDDEIVSDWIDVSDLSLSDFAPMQYRLYRADIGTVQFSYIGDFWEDSLYLPHDKFRVRIVGTNVKRKFRSLRLRVVDRAAPWVYLSETPPLRLEQLFRWGIDTQPFDVRVWTILDGDALLKTGDIVEWLEGAWSGMRYTVVSNKISQFPVVSDASVPETSSFKLLSQVLSMRKVKVSEQDGRVW